MRESSSWGACGKLAYLFSGSQGISSQLEMIWGSQNFPRVVVQKLVFLYTWEGCLRVSLKLPKGSQASCLIWCATQDGSGANALQMGFILILFEWHRTISHSCSDISVLLDLWQCSWGLSGVPTSKSRLLICLTENVELLCMQCREMGLISQPGGILIVFLELWWELGVHSRITAGLILQSLCLFSDVRTSV